MPTKQSEPIEIGETTIYKRNRTWWIRYSSGSSTDGSYKDHRHSLKVSVKALAIEEATRINDLLMRNRGGKIMQLKANRERHLSELANLYFEKGPGSKLAGETSRSKQREDRYIKLLLERYGDRSVASITPTDIAELFEDLGHLKPSSHNRYLARIISLFDYGVQRNWLVESPVEVRRAKVPKTKPRWFSDEEVERIFAELPPWTHMIWTILLQTGLRGAALWNLRWRDIDWDAKQLHLVDTKGKHEALLPVLDDTLDIFNQVREGMSFRVKYQNTRSPHLYMAITDEMIDRIPKRYNRHEAAAALGLSKGTYNRYVTDGRLPRMPKGLPRQDREVLRAHIHAEQDRACAINTKPTYVAWPGTSDPDDRRRKLTPGWDRHTRTYYIAPESPDANIFTRIDLKRGIALAGKRAGI